MGATKDSWYKRMNELIFDEEQIVTGVRIANEFKMSVFDAQNLLDDYVHNLQQRKLEEFHATFLLSGMLKNGKGLAFYLAKEDDLNDKKCLFDNISREIIYSIQKGKLIDFNIIASVNSVYEDCTGFLKSKNCVKRDIRSRKLPVLQSTSTDKQNIAPKNNESQSSNENNLEKRIQENGKNHSQLSQKQLKPKQSAGIASFFAKAPVKSHSNTKSENAKIKVLKQDVDGDEIQGISLEQSIQKHFVSDEKVKVDIDDCKDHKATTSKKVDGHVSKKRKKETKNNGPNKKRKRIQEVCDSDSSDMFDEENENIIEMSDEEPVHVPAVNPLPTTKNKKRKAVDKTYVDEEGFIVTSTEYIYESVSEDEENNLPKSELEEKVLPPKKNEKINAELKLSTNKGKPNKKQSSTKQPTLMSFFKKS